MGLGMPDRKGSGRPRHAVERFARGIGRLKRLVTKSLHGQREILDELAALRAEFAGLRADLDVARDKMMEGLRLAVEDEPRLLLLLAQARESDEFARAWDDPEPLVSVVIPTYTYWKLLIERSAPSMLAQTYPNIELVVVGDAAPPETGRALEGLQDPRVRYENLSVRGQYPDEDRLRWYVAGTAPMNRARQIVRGSWIAFLNDDDALRPEHVETLLAHARSSRAEVVYSKMLVHYPDGTAAHDFGEFPPVKGAFGRSPWSPSSALTWALQCSMNLAIGIVHAACSGQASDSAKSTA